MLATRQRLLSYNKAGNLHLFCANIKKISEIEDLLAVCAKIYSLIAQKKQLKLRFAFAPSLNLIYSRRKERFI